MKKDNIILLGIIEKQRQKGSYSFIKDLLLQFKYELYYESSRSNISCFYRDEQVLVLFNLEASKLELYQYMGLELDILIHNFLEFEEYKNILSSEQFINCKYYIINSDDENWTSLPLKNLKGIIITYGFNSKATLTISSYNIDQSIVANICLQREIVSINRSRVEPFELRADLSSDSKDDIYSMLAASALLMLLGYKEFNINI